MNSIQHIAGGKKKALLGVSEEKKNYNTASFLGGSFGHCIKRGGKLFMSINMSISDRTDILSKHFFFGLCSPNSS